MTNSIYKTRRINTEAQSEIDWVTHHCMQTVLETIPEFEKNADIVRQHFPNFTFLDMREMIVDSLHKPNHRILVVEQDEEDLLVGHAIFSLKQDKEGRDYGFCFSRYIHPRHRRKGLAYRLLQLAENWWLEQEAEYILAQTHIKNKALQRLFHKAGFQKSTPKQGKGYQFYELRKDLRIID